MEAGDFVVEYAKSGRAKCQSCRTSIAQGAVRVGQVVQGFNFDGVSTQWHHPHCLTKKPAAKRLCGGNLHGLSGLRWADQEQFIKTFPAAGGGPAANPHGLQVDFAKSNRSACKGCQKSIDLGQLRIGVPVEEEVGGAKKFHLAVPAWHHPQCFFQYHAEKVVNGLSSFDGVDQLDEWSVKVLTALVNGEEPPPEPNDNDNDEEDDGGGGDENNEDPKFKNEPRNRRSSKRLASAAADEDVKPAKRAKIKKEKETHKDIPKPVPGSIADAPIVKQDPETLARQSALRDQTNALWAARDLLPTPRQNKMKYLDILAANGIAGLEHKSVAELVQLLADAMVFGVAQTCPACGTNRLVPTESSYKCPAHLKWGRCGYTTNDPEFEPFHVDADETLPWTETYQYSPRPRLFARAGKAELSAQTLPTGDELKAEIKFKKSKNEEAVIISDKPFANRAFIFSGRLPNPQHHYQSLVENGGGSLLSHPRDEAEGLVLLVTTQSEMEKDSKKIKDARAAGIDIVDCSYISDCYEKGTRLNYKDERYLLEKNAPTEPAAPTREAVRERRARGEEAQERATKTARLTIKDGAVVDPDSHLEDSHHVYKEGDLLWSVVLSKADIVANSNSYYKLQILASDKGRGCVLFRSWGRVGTTRGGTKIEHMDREACKETFEELYSKHTGNDFNAPHFVKRPGLYYPLEIAGVNGPPDNLEDVSRASKTASRLAPQVQDLVKLIFDVKNMTNAMQEMEIDLRKMPLGKISPKMITEAYEVLAEAMDVALKGAHGVADRTKVVQLSNHFFTVIPHDFGSNSAPLLDNVDIIRAKLETLDALKEIEIATNMLKKEEASAGEDEEEEEHPLDKEFKKLNTAIEVLDPSSAHYQLIERCTKTTHAPTHSDYTLDIKNIFKIERSGERERYSGGPIGNKALLWHGSRISNYAGILSQGLRIAPPEAPVTGYMFGKSVYFADMVSKSANYCNASRGQRTGLLLLAEVALGEQMELVKSEFIEKLPPGIHSVKGCGQTGPSFYEYLPAAPGEDPIKVPMGPPKKQELPGRARTTELLYNEHMIYQETQCTLRYLVEVQFTFKR
ncbi:Poly [ADP-ribose] polymerase 1 [Geranomyces variabilis]|nr:Poly [ADP-ribose] polymerase 1 [Geranomyces variabilis]